MSTFLNCDPLQSNLCTIGDYVIDWKWNARDGTIVFTSGKGSDPDIQAQHPIVNEVVLAGTLYPIIRYVYIDGSKYTSEYEEGSLFSPDFIDCLSPVVVEAVNCSSTLGADAIYPYTITYVNTVDQGLNRSRLIKFDISSDTAYFAWEFGAATVADQIEIYYCTLADPVGTKLENYIHGITGVVEDLYPVNYPTNPKIALSNSGGTSPLALLTPLDAFTYQAGDYIKIQITGSIYEPTNYNTNWTVKFKCSTALELDFSTFIADSDMNKITSVPVIDFMPDPKCIYRASYNTLTSPFVNLPDRSTVPTTSIYRYLGGFYYWFGSTGSNPINSINYESPAQVGLQWKDVGFTNSMYNSPGFSTCMNLSSSQTITVSKTGDDYTYTFTDATDYQAYVDDIVAFKASAGYTAWLGRSDTEYTYYGYFVIDTIVSTSCGDVTTHYFHYFWFGDVITYDAINKTITITCNVPINNSPDVDCNGGHELVDSLIVHMTNTKNGTIAVPLVTSIRYIGTVTFASYADTMSTYETTKEQGFGISIQDSLLNGIDVSIFGFCKGIDSIGSNAWILPKYWDRVSFLDSSTDASRLGTFKLERKIGLRTDDCNDFGTTDWETVFQATTTTTTIAPTTTTTTTI